MVKRCAAQGGNCECNNGNVFFGPMEMDGVTPASFDDVWMNSPFAVKYNVSGTI